MRYVIAGVVLSGYVISVVPARLCHRDIGSFRKSLWVGYGDRDSWRTGIVLAYLAGGWPSLVVAAVWLTSKTRKALTDLRAEMHERRPSK